MIDYQIKDTDFIRITSENVTIDGKQCDTYRGENIRALKKLPEYFNFVTQILDNYYHLVPPCAIQVLSSITETRYSGRHGNPSSEHGLNVWVRLEFNPHKKMPLITQWNGICHWNEELLPLAPWKQDGPIDLMRHCAYACADIALRVFLTDTPSVENLYRNIKKNYDLSKYEKTL